MSFGDNRVNTGFLRRLRNMKMMKLMACIVLGTACMAFATTTTPTGGKFTAQSVPQGAAPITNTVPTPEPGFYGVLALGMTGMFAAVRRRKTNA
jgi:hypothetical protein